MGCPDMAIIKSPEQNERMVAVLQAWQKLERQAMDDAAAIIEETNSGLVRMIMSVIRHDSLMHHRVQQFLLESLTDVDISVSLDDLEEIWENIEQHDRLEKKTISMAKELLDEKLAPVQRHLLGYLLEDERKHDRLLGQLRDIKEEIEGCR